MTGSARRLGAPLLATLAGLASLGFALTPVQAQDRTPAQSQTQGQTQGQTQAQTQDRAAGARPASSVGWVRAGHFVPGMGSVQIALAPAGSAASMSVVAPRAGYGDVSTYQRAAPGSYTVQVRPRGAGTATQPMLSRAFTVKAGASTTIAVLGTSTQPRLAVLEDDLTPPATGQARVRVISSADRPVSVSADGGPTIASDVVLGQATGYTTAPQGRWRLQVSGASTTPVTQAVRLSSGSVYTLVVLGSGTKAPSVELVTDAAGAKRMPTGGVDTGGGGLVAQPEGASASLPAVPLGVLAGGVLLAGAAAGVGLRRRRA